MRFHQFFISVFSVSRAGIFNRYTFIDFPKPYPGLAGANWRELACANSAIKRFMQIVQYTQIQVNSFVQHSILQYTYYLL